LSVDHVSYINSPLLEPIKLSFSKNALSSLQFTTVSAQVPSEKTPFISNVEKQIMAFLNGKLQQLTFKTVLTGTAFQQKVWSQLCLIPFGKNPLPTVIPCHQVIGKNGELTGYLGGLHRKKLLLELEGYYTTKQFQLF